MDWTTPEVTRSPQVLHKVYLFLESLFSLATLPWCDPQMYYRWNESTCRANEVARSHWIRATVWRWHCLMTDFFIYFFSFPWMQASVCVCVCVRFTQKHTACLDTITLYFNSVIIKFLEKSTFVPCRTPSCHFKWFTGSVWCCVHQQGCPPAGEDPPSVFASETNTCGQKWESNGKYSPVGGSNAIYIICSA